MPRHDDPRHGSSFRSDIKAIGVEIRVAATGVRRSGRQLDGTDREFVRVFKTEMLQFAGGYARRFLQTQQKQDILDELHWVKAEARRLRSIGRTPEDILQELEVNYTAEAIRQRLNLPPFETQSPDDQTFATEYPEQPLAYKRTGRTPAPTDGVDPRNLYYGGGQHSLTKQQGERDEVPGYGESWTARKAAIYGRSL